MDSNSRDGLSERRDADRKKLIRGVLDYLDSIGGDPADALEPPHYLSLGWKIERWGLEVFYPDSDVPLYDMMAIDNTKQVYDMVRKTRSRKAGKMHEMTDGEKDMILYLLKHYKFKV